MASHADDSSVDDNLSSIGESQWDMIDEASAASEDDGNSISRQQTPFSEPPEHLQLDVGSLAGNDTSSESQGRSIHQTLEFSRPRRDSNSDPPDTARPTIPREYLRHSADLEFPTIDADPIIRFEQGQVIDGASGVYDFTCPLTSFEGDGWKKKYNFLSDAQIIGSVHQRMGTNYLPIGGPLKVLYSGPSEVGRQMGEKIGSALTCSLSESIDSSRYTVVHVSTVRKDEVALIPSTGIQLDLVECGSAGYMEDSSVPTRKTIQLNLRDKGEVYSRWNNSERIYHISGDYKVPDFAIIYAAERDTKSTHLTNAAVNQFAIRHDIPILIISPRREWEEAHRSFPIDPRSTHLQIEAFPDSGVSKVLDVLPIDLETFFNMDSSDLNRHLASFTTRQNPTTRIVSSEEKENFAHAPHKQNKGAMERSEWMTVYKYMALVISALLFMSAMRLVGSTYQRPEITVQPPSYPPYTPTATIPLPSEHSLILPKAQAEVRTKSLVPQHQNTDLASAVLEAPFFRNRSEKFQVHVVGDSHIILKPPRWFTMMKKTPQLMFKVQRKEKQVEHRFSTLFDGVYSLKLRREDAYGVLDVTVWTLKKPKIHEKFQVDFGTPWLKMVGWKRAAHAMTGQVREEFQTAHERANEGWRGMFGDIAEKADQIFKEVEKVGLDSLRQTTTTTEAMLAQSKAFSNAISERMRKHGAKAQRKLATHRLNLRHDLALYSRRMSTLISHQANVLTEAAAGLNVLALGQEIQEYRENHFREAQKKMLHAWWTVTGPPQSKQKPLKGRRTGCGRKDRKC